MVRLKQVLPALAAAALGFLLLGADGAPFISSDEAHALVKAGGLLLDVRTPEEFAEGHLPGAVNIPVEELEAKLASVPAKKDQPVVLYCRSGRRSETARKILEKAGFTKAKNLGPMSAWK